ncbi:MAG: glycosyltransferase family 4 protein [Marinagarivorans sp.]
MKILFLSHYFPPEVNAPATRTYEHCRQWAAAGHEVTVITCAPNHPKGEVFKGFNNSLYNVHFVDGIKVIRVWTYITANEGFLKRTLGYISYMVAAIIASLFVGKQEMVLSTSPQFFNGLAGFFVSKLKRSPWVLEIRDLWPESIVAVGAIKNATIIKCLERIEAFCYRKADHIIAVTQSFKKHILARGGQAEKLSVIYNGVDLSLFDSQENQDKAEAAAYFGVPYEPAMFFAAYVGTHGMAHHLETILEAAQILKDHPSIRFLMAGDGSEKAKLLTIKQEKSLENVIMLDQLPKADMPRLWQLVDASLVLLKKSDLFKTVIPSKIFESMAMQRPIVLGVEGEVADIIHESEAGLCIAPEDAQQLAAAVAYLHDQPTAAARLGENGLHYVARTFERSQLAAQFMHILEAIYRRRRQPHAARPLATRQLP